MSDDNYSGDLHAWIEPEIEARVVALILGEASDFEAEELERMMEERPEIRMFKQRLESVHGLLGAALVPPDDDDWELAPERKTQLLENLELAGLLVELEQRAVEVAGLGFGGRTLLDFGEGGGLRLVPRRDEQAVVILFVVSGSWMIWQTVSPIGWPEGWASGPSSTASPTVPRSKKPMRDSVPPLLRSDSSSNWR